MIETALISDGIDGWQVGERGLRLSGGEKQVNGWKTNVACITNKLSINRTENCNRALFGK